MFDYIWPIALAVLSNVVYHICAKSAPEGLSPFASLTVTYLVGTAAAAAMFFATGGGNLLLEYRKLNWASFAMGLAVVGLEVGFMFAYRAGWKISAASVAQSSFLAVALIFVGFLLYRETITAGKLAGMLICLVGLYFMNR